MCKQNLPALFIIMSSFMLISLFALALINMIYSILTPRNFDVFIQSKSDDYKSIYNYDFLMDLNFGAELELKKDYDIRGKIKYLCFTGVCNLESSNKITKNCSQACLTSTKYCYDGETICKTKICQNASESERNSACHEFNRIQYWRNTEHFRYSEAYKVTPYVDIVPKDKDCRYGYKKCGIINEKKDYLCLKTDKEFECPINDIIVKSNNEMEEGYLSFKLGDKYLFVSHDKTDNYIIKNLSVTLDIDPISDLIRVDNESYQNFSKYNYISLDGTDQPQFAFLNVVPFKFNYTYEEMMKKQELIDKKKGFFTEEKLNELNTEAIQYKVLLFGFGIAIFCTAFVYTICIYPCYCCDCAEGFGCPECCFLCTNEFFPRRHACRAYLIGFPILFMLVYSWILTIIKKISYNKLTSIEYIEEYKNMTKYEIIEQKYSSDIIKPLFYDFLENSIKYNNAQFIVLLITLILLLLYGVLIILIYRPDKEEVERNDYSTELV
jgi:hypothetical protein